MLPDMAGGLESLLRKLMDPGIEAFARLEAVIELLDHLDRYVTLSDYPSFLERSMPIFLNILRTPCILQVQTRDQQNQQELRNSSLELLRKLSASTFPTEPFEPYAEETLDLLLGLVRDDNECNVVLCMIIISNIVQRQHQALVSKLPSLLGLVSELFGMLEGIVTEQLDSPLPPGVAEDPSPLKSGEKTVENSQRLLGSQQPPRPSIPVHSHADPSHQARLLKGTQSFKVLSECTTLALSIFQAYEHTIPYGARLLPLITSILSCQAKAQEQAHTDGVANGAIFTGVSPYIKKKAAFGEFVAFQVKTMTLLAYLLEKSSDLADSRQFEEILPDIIVRLLKDCPRDKSGVTKELFTAIRSIVNNNKKFQKIFVPKLVDFLDERILIGDSLTTYETLRPRAYGMLADLIHHLRKDLQPNIVHKVVEVYSRNLLDSSPGTGFQTLSLKILGSMTKPITAIFDKANARHYLIIILNAMADKFVAVNQRYSNAIKLSRLDARSADGLADEKHSLQWDETDIFTAGPIKIYNRTWDHLEDNKFLFKRLMSTLDETLNLFRTLTDVLSTEEEHVMTKLVKAVPRGFCYDFSSEESKEFVHTFWSVCQCMHPAKLQAEIPELKAIAAKHSEQPLLHDAVAAITSFKWSASASGNTHDGGSADLDDESDDGSDESDDESGDEGGLGPNQRPEQFWTDLGRKLGKPDCHLMIEELCHTKYQTLRDWGVSQVDDLIKACGSIVALGMDTKFDAIIHTIKIVATLCSSETIRWEPKERPLGLLLKMAQQLQTDQLPPRLRLAAYQATDLLEDIFDRWLGQEPKALDALLRLVDAIATGKLMVLPNLRAIIYKHVISRRSAQFLNTVILRCLDVCASKSTSQYTQWYLLRDIVNPSVAMLIQRGRQQGNANLDEVVIESINSIIWKRGPPESPFQPGINHAVYDKFQLSALLVKYLPTRVQHKCQAIIDFALAYIQQDDPVIKSAAHVLIANCVARYKTTADLAVQTYLALLQCDSDECRDLILQGLRLMAPVMPERCQQRLEDENAVWAVGLRQVLAAAGTSKSHMATLLEFLSSQSKLFYHSRDKIAILALNCLYEVAPPSNSSPSSLRFAMGMMRLLWGWEHRRVNSRSIWSLGWSHGRGNQFVIPRMIEYLVELFVRLPHRKFPSAKFTEKVRSSVVAEQPPSEDLHDGAMELLFNLVQPQFWDSLDAGLPGILKKVLVGDETRAALAASDDVHVEKHINTIINALQACCIMVHFASEDWIKKHMVCIQEVFETCFISEKPEIREQVRAAQESKVFGKIQRIVESKRFTMSIKEKNQGGEKPTKAQGFMGFILGLFWPWMRPAKPERRSPSFEMKSREEGHISEKLPIPG